MIGCVAPGAGDALAVFLWGGIFTGALAAVIQVHRSRSFPVSPPSRRVEEPEAQTVTLRVVRPGPYDWSTETRSSEEGRTETKGTPPGRTSRG